MYDTIHFLLKETSINGGFTDNVVERVGDILTDINERYNRYTGELFLQGKLRNLTISVSTDQLKIMGSLQKFVKGNQLLPLNITEVKQGIQQLSDLLGLPIERSKITRMDIAQNIVTDYEPVRYYPFLGVATRYRREPINRSIYYIQGRKQLLVYDKINEMREAKEDIPLCVANKNLLRFEVRFMKQVANQLKIDITGDTLSNPSFFLNLINEWSKGYHSISKNNVFGGIELVRNVKDLEHFLLLNSIKHLGGETPVLEAIEQFKLAMNWENQKVTTFRNKIRRVAKTRNLTYVSPLIIELEKKVNDLVYQHKISL
jgi:hypothetical protein